MNRVVAVVTVVAVVAVVAVSNRKICRFLKNQTLSLCLPLPLCQIYITVSKISVGKTIIQTRQIPC